MKLVNPGVVALFTESSAKQSTDSAKINLFDTGYAIDNACSVAYQKIEDTGEIWFSYDVVSTLAHFKPVWFVAQSSTREKIASLSCATVNDTTHLIVRNKDKDLYTSDASIPLLDGNKHNIEIHLKTGAEGRIDVWIDTKLFMSYRTPTDLIGTISYIGIDNDTHSSYDYHSEIVVSSIIMQNTRRIGLEKFKKLTIDPATEQNMAQGSLTSFTVSGLTDAAEFSDITGVAALLQPTSRDANISVGTFALNGVPLGTVDVSSSSGKDYVSALATENATKAKPWTRDDIEGKTLTLKVDGAV